MIVVFVETQFFSLKSPSFNQILPNLRLVYLLHKSSFNNFGLIICINTIRIAVDHIGSSNPA